jgi:hypothetical protein
MGRDAEGRPGSPDGRGPVRGELSGQPRPDRGWRTQTWPSVPGHLHSARPACHVPRPLPAHFPPTSLSPACSYRSAVSLIAPACRLYRQTESIAPVYAHCELRRSLRSYSYAPHPFTAAYIRIYCYPSTSQAAATTRCGNPDVVLPSHTRWMSCDDDWP